MDKNQYTDKDRAQAIALVDRIFRENYPTLIKYAKLALYGAETGDIGRAEDVVQNAMLTTIDSPLEFCGSTNPTGWLIQTIRFTANNAIRADNRMKKLISEYFYLTDTVKHDAHDIDFLFSGVIPDQDFQLLKRHYIEGYSYRELQEELNLSLSALSMRMQRAKAKFIKNYLLTGEKDDTTGHNKIGGVQNADEQ